MEDKVVQIILVREIHHNNIQIIEIKLKSFKFGKYVTTTLESWINLMRKESRRNRIVPHYLSIQLCFFMFIYGCNLFTM